VRPGRIPRQFDLRIRRGLWKAWKPAPAGGIADVAEIIGAPQNTVKTRMFYARKRVAELLDAYGFDAAA
jgi:hypothetical protein